MSGESKRRYQTIVADPPWDYGNKKWASDKGGRYGSGVRVENPIGYPTMPTTAICDLPVGDMADNHCRLFLWTTNRHLPDAFRVIDQWGFRYTQGLIWRKIGTPSPFMGSGVALQTHEYLLVARRGRPPVLEQIKASVIDAPRQSRHSAKPDCFLDYIEQVSPGPYLEMFARRARFGWDYWGNESLGTAEVAA